MEAFGRKLRCPIIGPAVGKILYLMTVLKGARRVFEMGSGFGYSAYWFALAMPFDGEVVLTDYSANMLRLAVEFFKKAKIEHKIIVEKGDALEIIDRYQEQFDIIFTDIDKKYYPEAFGKALPKLKTGGLLIADNVLRGGQVVFDIKSPDVLGIKEFTRLIYESSELITTIIPVRDGLSISLKR